MKKMTIKVRMYELLFAFNLKRQNLTKILEIVNLFSNDEITNAEWKEINQKIPVETIKQLLLTSTGNHRASFLNYLERANEISKFLFFKDVFKETWGIDDLKKMVYFHSLHQLPESSREIFSGYLAIKEMANKKALAADWLQEARIKASNEDNYKLFLEMLPHLNKIEESEIMNMITGCLKELTREEENKEENKEEAKTQECLTALKNLAKLLEKEKANLILSLIL